MTLIVLGVYTLAVMRLTRLINADTILDRPRLAIIARARLARAEAVEASERGQAARSVLYQSRARRWATVVYWVRCPWCVSMWIALASAALPVWVLGWPWWALLPVALAASHVTGVFARWADTEEIEVVEDDVT